MQLTQESFKLALILTKPIKDIGLSVSSYGSLVRWGVRTVGDLISLCMIGELHRVRGVGVKAYEEITHKLDQYLRECGVEVRWTDNDS